MRLFGGFHDACIREVHVETGHYVPEDLRMTVDWQSTVHVLVQRQSCQFSAIEMRFEELLSLGLHAPPEGHENIIYDASIFILDSVFYWVPNADGTSQPPTDGTCVAARQLYWRDASDWLGPELRYRPVDRSGGADLTS